ncbi:MAG: PhoH family protein [Clostridia bacterium]|nr:PhoH family protein [Clostridia bacterium]
MSERIIEANSIESIVNLFGKFDENAKLIERELGVVLINRDTMLKITGDERAVSRAEGVLRELLKIASRGEAINEQNIRYLVDMPKETTGEEFQDALKDSICVNARGTPIRPKTIGQKKYVDAIRNNTITIGVGPAGTGKTYLAVAMAVLAFKRKEISRIILTRPAVEAGEKLGFLPGDLQNKVDPYLRPLYDGLFEMLGAENFTSYQEKGMIEVAPLAYMRGRTLDDSFIILDEAQNTTREQMKMFLTRIGFNSKVVITGDVTQVDLPDGKKSGLKNAIKILKGIDDIAIFNLSERDVVRHPLIQKIIKAYARYDEIQNRN